MYFYKIGYFSPEESDYVELWHEEKFTDEEIEKMVHGVVRDALENIGSFWGRND